MSEEAPQPEKPNISAALTAWRWPIVVVFVALFALIAFVYILRTPERLIESAVKGAANFQKATITQTFTASLPEFESERGGLLELAKVTATESFKSQDELKYDFRWFELSAGRMKRCGHAVAFHNAGSLPQPTLSGPNASIMQL